MCDIGSEVGDCESRAKKNHMNINKRPEHPHLLFRAMLGVIECFRGQHRGGAIYLIFAGLN